MKVGDKVNYYCGRGTKDQNGIIKTLSSFSDRVFVVYNCNNDWDNYQNYTAELTYKTDLMSGWKGEIQ